MCRVSGHYLGMISFQRPNPLAFQLGFDVPMFDVLPSCDLGRSLGKRQFGKRQNALTLAI